MRTTLLLVTSTLALAACGPKANDATPTANGIASSGNMDVGSEGMADDGSMATAPLATADFIAKAAMSDLYEISAGKIAEDKATAPALRRFATQMVEAHNLTTRDLKAAAAKDGVAAKPPATLDAPHQALIAALESTPQGTVFDTLYKQQQREAHTEALATMQGYAASGDKSAVKAFATETATKVQMHIDMLGQIN